MLGDYTFNSCEWLSRIASRQKTYTVAGDEPHGVRRDEVVLPAALEKVGHDVFVHSPEIRVIWVDSDSVLDSLRRCVRSAAILPAGATVGGKPLWELRRQRNVVIPEGTQEIGAQWFMNSNIESAAIPASVTVIGE